ncbi:hypothetical protein PHJA_002485500 [Phtheirospermum japonicum]|uniref:Uncharacterized protein n=1 Tax=Phtheirospermum japonicum TaxID=374723 RepID=A0A830CW34_9LAMI|nr:hypothetical protein PHJA_002485500 [Phtheirospermum japonicum]
MKSEEKKLSFGFSFADENIKLIDILTENDDFLVDSPFCGSFEDPFSDRNIGFRVSGFRNSPELGIFQQKDQNQFSDLVQLPKPSFHRKSLAWDSGFFDSPGVLDPVELSCINRGVKTTEAHSQDVCKPILELKSRPNDDGGFCADWFEIEPSLYKPKSTKTFHVTSKALKKKSTNLLETRLNLSQTCTGKSINKMESTVRKRQGPISSPKLPKALGRNNATISGISKVNSSTITDSGQVLFTKKKSGSQSWSSLNDNTGSSAPTPSLLKRKPESRESRLRGSLSASTIRDKNISPSDRWSSEALSSSVRVNKQRYHGSKIHPDVMKSFGGPFVGNDENEASHLQSPLNTPRQNSRIRSVGSLSANSFRPSGLRLPSPQIGFFDEFAYSNSENILSPNKARRYSWARKKLKSACSEVAKNIKRPKTGHTNLSLVTDQESQMKKNLSCSDVDQLGNLSRCFAAIDLKREKLTQPRKRAPLADKTSSYNSCGTFAN